MRDAFAFFHARITIASHALPAKSPNRPPTKGCCLYRLLLGPLPRRIALTMLRAIVASPRSFGRHFCFALYSCLEPPSATRFDHVATLLPWHSAQVFLGIAHSYTLAIPVRAASGRLGKNPFIHRSFFQRLAFPCFSVDAPRLIASVVIYHAVFS